MPTKDDTLVLTSQSSQGVETTRIAALPLTHEDDDNDDDEEMAGKRNQEEEEEGKDQKEHQQQQQDRLESDENAKKKLKERRHFMERITKFWTIKVLQIVFGILIICLSFSKQPFGLVDPQSGDIIDTTSMENTNNGVILVDGDERPVVARGSYEKACLAISRVSAFSMYPLIIFVFLSKCRALLSFLSTSPLSMYLIHDTHELHVFAGVYIAFAVWIHAFFHLLRWGHQGNINTLLFAHPTGISGWIVLLATPVITFPMMYFKKSIRYEIRKGLHYLFYLFGLGLCFHVPISALPKAGFIAPVLGSCLVIYTLDALYVYFFMTEKIETTVFHVLPSGVQMTMAVSEQFQKRGEQGGFAYICLPWVDRNQWHAFSLFEHIDDPSKRQVFMQNVGNWTKSVHDALQRRTVRPAWIQGPFPSPFSNAGAFDNQILIASGIGITPALSVIRAHKEYRRTNLIWAVRDAAMLEFFMKHVELDNDAWNLIFYTGKRPLNPALDALNTNIRIIRHRPNLHFVIPNIIYGIEGGTGLPEKYLPKEMALVEYQLVEKLRDLDADPAQLDTNMKLIELTAFAQSCGFVFSELVNALEEEEEEEKSEGPIFSEEIDTTQSGRTLDGSAMLQRLRIFADKHYPTTITTTAATAAATATTDLSHRGSFLVQRRGGLLPSKYVSSSSIISSTRSNPFAPRASSSAPATSSTSTSSSSNKKKTNSVLTSVFTPWKEQPKASSFVKSLDKARVLSTWGMLYCGGSKPVEKVLREISSEYDISLNSESFEW